MKELKFRAWDTEQHCWVEGLILTLHTSGRLIHVPPHIELTQYIGLKDRLGREIYEGDILKCFHYDLLYQVVWEYLGFVFKGMTKPGVNTCCVGEVIGDIYKTPDLIRS